MSTTVDILCFLSTCITPDNQLLEVKNAFNLETLRYVGTLISHITQIFSHSVVAVARHKFM